MIKKFKSAIIIISICSLLGLIKYNVLANGGPIDSNGITEAGNINFINVKEIELTSEELIIDINENEINVSVTYNLYNNGSSRDIIYDFPIKLYKRDYETFEEIYLKNIKMYDSEKELKYTLKKEPVQSDEQYENKITHHYIAKLNFNENEAKQLTVFYSIKPEYTIEIPAEYYQVFLSTEAFYYDFTPASNWANGKANTFKLTLDYKDIANQCNDISTNIPGFKFDKQEGLYEYSSQDVDFKILKNIYIVYDRTDYKMKNEFILNNDVIDKVIVSSTLSNQGNFSYSPINIFDKNIQTAWVEGCEDLGIGESIEIYLEQNTKLSELGIINGYTSSQDIYDKNSRVKKLKIEIYKKTKSGEVYLTNTHLTDLNPEKKIDANSTLYDLIDNCNIYPGNGETYNNIYKIVLTILDVKKGNRYNDTCISEIVLYGYTNKDVEYKKGFDTVTRNIDNNISNTSVHTEHNVINKQKNIDQPANNAYIPKTNIKKETPKENIKVNYKNIIYIIILIALVIIFIIKFKLS